MFSCSYFVIKASNSVRHGPDLAIIFFLRLVIFLAIYSAQYPIYVVASSSSNCNSSSQLSSSLMRSRFAAIHLSDIKIHGQQNNALQQPARCVASSGYHYALPVLLPIKDLWSLSVPSVDMYGLDINLTDLTMLSFSSFTNSCFTEMSGVFIFFCFFFAF